MLKENTMFREFLMQRTGYALSALGVVGATIVLTMAFYAASVPTPDFPKTENDYIDACIDKFATRLQDGDDKLREADIDIITKNCSTMYQK